MNFEQNGSCDQKMLIHKDYTDWQRRIGTLKHAFIRNPQFQPNNYETLPK